MMVALIPRLPQRRTTSKKPRNQDSGKAVHGVFFQAFGPAAFRAGLSVFGCRPGNLPHNDFATIPDMEADDVV
jgi:hypothetical protein